ncbi:MAG TPA: M36 family metallopeptidase [Blastocatellia bacterium]|nr:M36 family metallopeptidase [Blastocatellia bacterium]
MRATLYLLLAAAMVISLLPQSAVTRASNQNTTESAEGAVWPSQSVGLPDYDIREELGAAQPGQASQSILAKLSGVSLRAVDLPARQRAIDTFRNQLAPGAREQLRVTMNEAGLPKMFFNTAAPISLPQVGSPDTIARGFLAAHPEIFGLTQAQVREIQIGNEDHDQGTTFLNYHQTAGGITVFQGQVQVTVNPIGQVLSVNEGLLVPELNMDTTPKLSELEGLQQAFVAAGRVAPENFVLAEDRTAFGGRAAYRNPLGENYENVLSEMKIMRIGQQAVLAWHSYVEVGSSEWYEVVIDANTGTLLYRYNLYSDTAQGMVYRESGLGARTLESFVGDEMINTPDGWMAVSTVTTGNNVDAYLDTDANNQPDTVTAGDLMNGHAFSPMQDFTFPFVLGLDPRIQQASSVAELFYLNNVMHDFAYRLGFTESAGNFQINNYGRGGLANDPVRAESQDGSGTNNANFGTPTDGQRPRMQMFLFTRGTATDLNDDRDSSFDADVVFHEYGHGISNRLVGGPTVTGCMGGTQAGAIGEGTSDYWAATFFNDGMVGEFVTNNFTRGIRRAAYTVPASPLHDSYADVGTGGFEVHRDGEVWAATLWDLRQTVGAPIADRLVMQGFKFTACRPSFLDNRDGILLADQNLNNVAGQCAIWRVFARHGMGVSAVGNNGTTHVAATDIPAYCSRYVQQ